MRFVQTLIVTFGLIWTAPAAFAGPEGDYRVVGTNPDSKGEYEGVVSVRRNGETYQVIWDVQGTRFVGVGLGAVIRDGRFLVGPANKNDIAISVSYISGDSYGLAMYFEREDGSWEGVWTYGGSDQVATENWYRRK